MKSRRCPHGKHDYEGVPYRVDAAYQQAPDGSRIDGRWLGFRCRQCGHTIERWESDDPRAAALNITGDWSTTDERAIAEPESRSIWERPILYWILAVLVAGLAVYGYYWDSQIRSGPRTGTEIIKPTPAGGSTN